MADFLTNLFNSIFTPGPTPTLLVATNVSFAALQVVLLFLLVSTYSIHFLVLSGLSAGLWWSINWFVAELRVEAEKERVRKEEQGAGQQVEDSETEGEVPAKKEVDIGTTSVSGSHEVEVIDTTGAEVKDRRGMLGTPAKSMDGSRSDASTEDEWERVDENEKDK